MKRYLRHALVYVLVFVLLASQLAISVYAESGKTATASGFWGLFEYTAEGNPNMEDFELDILNGAFRVKLESDSETGESGNEHGGGGISIDDSKKKYEQAVSKMENDTGSAAINSAGSVLVYVPFSYYLHGGKITGNKNMICFNGYGTPGIEEQDISIWTGHTSFTKNYQNLQLYWNDNGTYSNSYFYIIYELNAPIYGIYKRLPSTDYTGYSVSSTGVIKDHTNQMSGLSNIGSNTTYIESKTIHAEFQISNIVTADRYASFVLPRYLMYECIPLAGAVKERINNYINYAENRVGSIIANYGYVNGDGQQIISDNVQIVNEGNKSYYNPVTNTTTNYNDWTYDYSSRTYTLTTNSGNTTITYGDEYMTIQEGDTVYNIQYITYQKSGDESSSSSSGSGSGSSSSSSSGSSSGGSGSNDDDGGVLGALGDVLGALIKGIGALITPVFGAIVDFLVSIVDKVLEGLGAFSNLLLQMLAEIPKMFTGFTDFLVAVFPFMPTEFATLIIFGLLLTIVAAVIKKFLG